MLTAAGLLSIFRGTLPAAAAGVSFAARCVAQAPATPAPATATARAAVSPQRRTPGLMVSILRSPSGFRGRTCRLGKNLPSLCVQPHTSSKSLLHCPGIDNRRSFLCFVRSGLFAPPQDGLAKLVGHGLRAHSFYLMDLGGKRLPFRRGIYRGTI